MSSSGSSHLTDHTGAKAKILPEVCAGTSGESEVTDVSKRYPSRKELENALLESRESEAQLRRIIDTIPTLAWCNLPNGSNDFLNKRWHDYTGLSAEEAHGWGWKAAIHPEDLPMLMQEWKALLDADKPGECEVRLRRFDVTFRSFLCRVEPLRCEGREAVRWYGTATDIEDHKREEDLAAGEKLLLEMVTSGHSMPGILDSLCQFVESATNGCCCSVVLVDPTGTRLEHGAAPSLPDSFITSIVGRPVNAESGPCAMAAYLNEQVIAADLTTETRWADYEWCPMALAHGMRACWSTPIRSAAGEVVGAFAI
jgi:PAS domain S-box-containing protein